MNRSGESMAEEKSGKKVNSVSAQGGMGKSREPEVDSEGGPNNELNALRNAATRSTTGQDGSKGKPDPKKNTYGTSHIDDYHKQVNDHLLQNGTKPSDIAYNFEGKPIVTYDAMGNPVAIPPGKDADVVKRLGEIHAKREQNKADGVFFKMFSGMSDATASIAAGLDGAMDKSIEGIGKAVVEGGKAAGEAVGKTVDEFKNNEELQTYTGIALGAGGLPIAMASGVAVAPALIRTGTAVSGIVENAAQGVASRIATSPSTVKNLKRGYDFVSAFNPGELPPVSWAGALGTAIANRDRIRETGEVIRKQLKPHLGDIVHERTAKDNR
ncbi:hypothetical protein [Maridesulfovibrio frigidus]|uniref:hypothetical protein n=1 Tax=Maridesulfovibrio frigidus TaxID=340956 RepID=UPI0004E1D814|nr:hypothetical protein [Maridesulfovibrio frigidus]